MLKENPLLKSDLRKHFLLVRKSLSRKRRFLASLEITKKILALPFKNILSFSSFGSEISLTFLNSVLAKQNRLFLPKVEEKTLGVYAAFGSDLSKLLLPSSLGMKEPNPALCEKGDLFKVDLILVPGLGFDRKNHRLGYGKGYYDKLLEKSPPAIGVGFKEQLTDSLALDPWDIPLSKTLLG